MIRNINMLINEGYIRSSDDFLNILDIVYKKSSGIVSDIAGGIIELIEDEDHIDDSDIKQNYFNNTEKEDMVSFVQNDRVPSNSEDHYPYSMSRNEMKIGKVIRYLCSLINLTVTDQDIEKFVNSYKALSISDNKINFRIVSGDDIAKYYDEDYYYNDLGTLGNSCMAEKKSSYFDIYSKNASCQMLIYVDKDDKIYGRALLWKLSKSPCEASIFMDRVYTNSDSLVIKFIEYAKNNDWMYKRKMSYDDTEKVHFIYKGKEVCGIIKVELEDGYFDRYPFVDTLTYLSKKRKSISNIPTNKCRIMYETNGKARKCSDCVYADGINIWSTVLCYSCSITHKELANNNIKTKYNEL